MAKKLLVLINALDHEIERTKNVLAQMEFARQQFAPFVASLSDKRGKALLASTKKAMRSVTSSKAPRAELVVPSIPGAYWEKAIGARPKATSDIVDKACEAHSVPAEHRRVVASRFGVWLHAAVKRGAVTSVEADGRRSCRDHNTWGLDDTLTTTYCYPPVELPVNLTVPGQW